MPDPEPNQRLGRFVETPVAGEIVRAFVPPPLPPAPPIDVLALLDRLSLAERALGRLDGITMLLPRQELFLYMYVRKEAVLSSQIEGTQSSLADLLLFEIDEQPGVPLDDAHKVSRCVAAMGHGVQRLRSGVPTGRIGKRPWVEDRGHRNHQIGRMPLCPPTR